MTSKLVTGIVFITHNSDNTNIVLGVVIKVGCGSYLTKIWKKIFGCITMI